MRPAGFAVAALATPLEPISKPGPYDAPSIIRPARTRRSGRTGVPAPKTLQGLLLAGPLTNRQDRHRINAFPGEEFRVNPAGHGLCAHNDRTERSLGHRFDPRRGIQPCREGFHGRSTTRPSQPPGWGGGTTARAAAVLRTRHTSGRSRRVPPCDGGLLTRWLRPWARPQEDLDSKTT